MSLPNLSYTPKNGVRRTPKSEERLLKRGVGGPYSFGSSWLGSNAQQRALSGQKKGEVDPFLTLVQALLKGSWSLCTLLS